MNERLQIAAKLLTSHIGLVVCLILFSIVSTKDAFLFLSLSQTILIILYLSGYWEFFGIRFRKLFCIVFQIIIFLVFFWRILVGLNYGIHLYLILCLSSIQAYLLFELIKIIIVIYKRDQVFLDILFPFKSGDYLITDGGNSKLSRLMNYHYYSAIHKKNKTNNSMIYATDIVKISNDKNGFLPKSNDRYPIFNEKIFCPLDGEIVKVENSIPDNYTYSGNYPYNTGNTVVIKKDNYYLLLGHLKKDSIRVKEGDLVRRSDFIGLVGNSGWTERPHLHMQLIESGSNNYWLGKGICIRYANKNLFKNRLIRI